MYDTQFYQTPAGRIPFQDWIESVRDARAVDLIVNRLARVRAGNLGDHRSLGDGVYELRFFFGPGFRIYYALPRQSILLLLIGGAKSNQRADIEKAKAWYADHQAREIQS